MVEGLKSCGHKKKSAMGAGGGGDNEEGQVDEEEMEVFTTISEDILINVFAKLEDDPRYWACLACVCSRFSSIIRTIFWKKKCMQAIPSVVADLLRNGRPADKLKEPPGGWAGLQKLAVCCPGLWHAGVLLDSWDFGLERDIGPSEDYKIECRQIQNFNNGEGSSQTEVVPSCPWTVFDDLHFEFQYPGVMGFVENSNEVVGLRNEEEISNLGGFEQHPQAEIEAVGSDVNCNPINPSESQISLCGNADGVGCRGGEVEVNCNPVNQSESQVLGCGNDDGGGCRGGEVEVKRKESPSADENCCDEDLKRRKRENHHPIEPHLATGMWNLTREQGNKLLQSRFRGDSLYICDFPGCVHSEEKRTYRLFRGIFKNFKSSHVWRNIKDMKAKKTVLNCAFCSSKGTWDMLTTFCLRRSFEYHDDGEPVVRAYVCENGHVAGAWTDRPMYN